MVSKDFETAVVADDCSAIIDSTGKIIGVSESWLMSSERFPDPVKKCGVGHSYFEYCACPEAQGCRRDLQNLLSGKQSYFVNVYDCGSEMQFRPFALIAAPMPPAGSGKFVLHHISLDAHLAKIGPILGAEDIEKLKSGVQALSTWRAADGNRQHILTDLFTALDALQSALDHGGATRGSEVYRCLTSLLNDTAKAIDRVANWTQETSDSSPGARHPC